MPQCFSLKNRWRKTLQTLACLSALTGLRTWAFHQNAIMEFGTTSVTRGDGFSTSNVRDDIVTTGITISDTVPSQQWVNVNFGNYYTRVNAVLFFTDEALMTSGTIEFYVDGVRCPDTSGVGVNGVGGVFNCGLSGYNFKAICTTPCSP